MLNSQTGDHKLCRDLMEYLGIGLSAGKQAEPGDWAGWASSPDSSQKSSFWKMYWMTVCNTAQDLSRVLPTH